MAATWAKALSLWLHSVLTLVRDCSLCGICPQATDDPTGTQGWLLNEKAEKNLQASDKEQGNAGNLWWGHRAPGSHAGEKPSQPEFTLVCSIEWASWILVRKNWLSSDATVCSWPKYVPVQLKQWFNHSERFWAKNLKPNYYAKWFHFHARALSEGLDSKLLMLDITVWYKWEILTRSWQIAVIWLWNVLCWLMCLNI